MSDWIENNIGYICVGIVTFPIMLLIAVLIHESGPSFSLLKSEWSCTQTHDERHLALIGKILMPITENICTQWSKH